jgi:hypothetical protein
MGLETMKSHRAAIKQNTTMSPIDSEPRITILARTSRNLAVTQSVVKQLLTSPGLSCME